MAKPKIFITRRLPDDLIKELKKDLDISMWDEVLIPVPREILIEKAREVDGLLTMLSDKVDQPLLEEAQHLKVVANLAVGFDNIDVRACIERSIHVCNTPDVLTDTTADLTFALLMATARRIVEAAAFIKNGEWTEWGPFLLSGQDIHHKTIGIVGMGRIGTAVAKRAKGFDMTLLYHNRSRNLEVEETLGAEYVSFETLLEKADYVVNLLPLTTETVDKFNAEAFKQMKESAIFINAGRGKSVDETALYEALKTKEIAGAGLDVFREEPTATSHPLLSLKNVIALPHIGSASTETRANMVKLALKNLYAVLVSGEKPLTPVK